MKRFSRNIISLCLLLAVIFMSAGSAAALIYIGVSTDMNEPTASTAPDLISEYQQYQEAGVEDEVEDAETTANAEDAACGRYEAVYTPFCDCETINCPHGCN